MLLPRVLAVRKQSLFGETLSLARMTIHRDWIGIMKEECPCAFTKSIPFRPEVAYLDGMPLLMKAGSISTWSELVKFNFARHVKKFYGMGATVVVLAFDAYAFVPGAKSITQANRSKKAVKCEFDNRAQLPTTIPVEYNDFMRNRAFKRRVVQLVVETLPDLIGLARGQKFIIDYESCPIEFTLDATTNKVVQDFMLDVPPMGECDVKFTRWFRRFGDGVAYSVDGDFIPIALMNYEAELRALGAQQQASVLGNITDGTQQQMMSLSFRNGRPARICILRLEFGAGKDEDEDEVGVVGNKRALQGSLRQQAGGRGGVENPKKKKGGRPMEYVCIPLLYESLFIVFRQMSGTGYNSRMSHDTRFMEMLACLIGLTGTDFTRNLPYVGVKKLWDTLSKPSVWSALLRSYDVDSNVLDRWSACNMFVSRVYSDVYSRHVPTPSDCLETTLRSIKSSGKISDRTKNMLPSVPRVDTTTRNINWLLLYWRCQEPQRDPNNTSVWLYNTACPDPVCEEYGFARKKGGAVQWLEEAAPGVVMSGAEQVL